MAIISMTLLLLLLLLLLTLWLVDCDVSLNVNEFENVLTAIVASVVAVARLVALAAVI